MGKLAINISSLASGPHQFTLQPEVEDVGLDTASFRDVRVDLKLDRGEDRIFASFTAEALAWVECDRTLQMFDLPVSGSYQVMFLPEDEVRGDEETESVRVLHPDDEEIELADAVRDTLLLAVPQRKIAPGAEEVEIPTQFGEFGDDDIADPRWEALRKLRDSED
jgi:uncharacterized protein